MARIKVKSCIRVGEEYSNRFEHNGQVINYFGFLAEVKVRDLNFTIPFSFIQYDDGLVTYGINIAFLDDVLLYLYGINRDGRAKRRKKLAFIMSKKIAAYIGLIGGENDFSKSFSSKNDCDEYSFWEGGDNY